MNENDKMILQIIITVVVVLFSYFLITPIAPLMFGLPYFNRITFLVAISTWAFGFSIAWMTVDTKNEIINSLLFCAMLPMGWIIFYEAVFMQIIWDVGHGIPFVVGVFITFFRRKTLRLEYVLMFNLIVFVWFEILMLFGIYVMYKLPMDIMLMANFILAILVTRRGTGEEV